MKILYIVLYTMILHYQLNACVSKGLLLHYEFENNFLYSSGYGYHGESHGLMAFSSDSIEGKSAVFDGDDDWIGTPFFVKPHTGSISVWLKVSNENMSTAIIDASQPCKAFSFNVSNNLVTNYVKEDSCGNLEGQRVDVNPNVNVADWNHYVFIWGENGKKIYIDGKILDANSNKDFSRNLEKIVLGREAGSEENFFKGQMDEFRLYDRELTQEEVDELYNFKNGHCYKTYTEDELNTAILSAQKKCSENPADCGINTYNTWDSHTPEIKVLNQIDGKSFFVNGYYIKYGDDSFDWLYIDSKSENFYKLEVGCKQNGSLRWQKINIIPEKVNIDTDSSNGKLFFEFIE